MRYVMWIAVFRESSNLWTQLALVGYPCEHASLSICFSSLSHLVCDEWNMSCHFSILRVRKCRFKRKTLYAKNSVTCSQWDMGLCVYVLRRDNYFCRTTILHIKRS